MWWAIYWMRTFQRWEETAFSVPLNKRAVIVWLRGDEDFVTDDRISPWGWQISVSVHKIPQLSATKLAYLPSEDSSIASPCQPHTGLCVARSPLSVFLVTLPSFQWLLSSPHTLHWTDCRNLGVSLTDRSRNLFSPRVAFVKLCTFFVNSICKAHLMFHLMQFL